MFSTKPLLLVTPHHVGTWFWFKFLTSHHQVGGFVCDEYIRWHHEHINENRPERRVRNYTNTKEIIKTNSDYTLYHSHPPKISSNHFCMLLSMVPTFISLRDPLLSVISHIKRAEKAQDKTFNPVNDWTSLVSNLKGIEGILSIPMDLLVTENEKKVALFNVLNHFGLSLDTPIVDKTINNWTLVNSFGAHPLEAHYRAGNINHLRRGLGTFWEDLRKSQSLVRPYLESVGYKNLLWWS